MFRTFEIEILTSDNGIQVELAQVGDRQMLIATDLGVPIRSNVFRQEAYGPAQLPADRTEIIAELSARILSKRTK